MFIIKKSVVDILIKEETTILMYFLLANGNRSVWISHDLLGKIFSKIGSINGGTTYNSSSYKLSYSFFINDLSFIIITV